MIETGFLFFLGRKVATNDECYLINSISWAIGEEVVSQFEHREEQAGLGPGPGSATMSTEGVAAVGDEFAREGSVDEAIGSPHEWSTHIAGKEVDGVGAGMADGGDNIGDALAEGEGWPWRKKERSGEGRA